MSVNKLKANDDKTHILVTRKDKKTEDIVVKIGKVNIKETQSEKLLGVHIDNNLKWTKHLKELEVKLKYRLYCLRRLSEILPDKELKSTAEGIFMSQVRYALPLWCPTRINADDPHSTSIRRIEVEFNNCLRLLNKCQLKDKVSIEKMLENTGWFSINQLSAETRLVEAWKCAYIENYSLQDALVKQRKGSYQTRRNEMIHFERGADDLHGSTSFVNTTAKLWEIAPEEIKKATSLNQAKNQIRKFVKNCIAI